MNNKIKMLTIDYIPLFSTPLKTEKERATLKALYDKAKAVSLKHKFEIRGQNDRYTS
ncbi:hypothetical protein [Aeromonas phage AerS_266]|nr:hypothetical protein [Aeromonas phage AerS_266]